MTDPCIEEGFAAPVGDGGWYQGQDLVDSENAPFIHRFYTQRHKYVYDVNTRRIIRVSDAVWNALEDVGRLSDQQMIAKLAPLDSREQVISALGQIT